MSDQNDMEKLASEVPSILAEASGHLRKMASLNATLIDERDTALYELRLHKVARRMEERGLEADMSFEQKLAHLQSIDPSKMDSFEHAIELSTGGFKLGSLQKEETVKEASDINHSAGENGSSANHEALDRAILTGFVG